MVYCKKIIVNSQWWMTSSDFNQAYQHSGSWCSCNRICKSSSSCLERRRKYFATVPYFLVVHSWKVLIFDYLISGLQKPLFTWNCDVVNFSFMVKKLYNLLYWYITKQFQLQWFCHMMTLSSNLWRFSEAGFYYLICV